MFETKKNLLSVAVIAAKFGLTACGGSSSGSTPPPVNSAPTDITLSVSNVSENETGAVIGDLSATDADASDTFTFAVNDDRFEIDGATLKLKAENALNFEQEANVSLSVTVSASATYSKDITVDVDDLLDYYGFKSKNMPGESAVSYSGQVARQILISDLFKFIGANLSDATEFNTNGAFVNREAVMDSLNSYFDVAGYAVA
jgi:hypothetical protein